MELDNKAEQQSITTAAYEKIKEEKLTINPYS